jgi:Mn2+/Fe2+ NRAMP family transporter
MPVVAFGRRPRRVAVKTRKDGAVVGIPDEATPPHEVRPSRGDYLRELGPGLISGAAGTDPTTVATLVVVGATTVYGLAWLALLVFPLLAVVQVLATRVGFVSGRDLQQATGDGYGRVAAGVLLASVLAVNVLTVAADLEAGAAALSLLVHVDWGWFVVPLAVLVVVLLFRNGYDEVERVLRYVLLCLLAYAAAVVLARPHWTDVARGTLVPSLRLDHDHIAGALALLGTTVTTYMYLWQTVEQVEQPSVRWRVKLRQFDAIAGTALAAGVFWAILVASGATLGVHHKPVDTAEQAAAALRPAAGPLAAALFGVALLASTLIALPVIVASAAYATGAFFRWPRGLSRKVTEAPAFYSTVAAVAAAGAVLAAVVRDPIHLLFTASVAAGLATPVGLVLLVLVAGNRRLLDHDRPGRWLLAGGWFTAGLLTLLSLVYLAQVLHLFA